MEANSSKEYKSEFKELEVIGRGNFGTATLVQSSEDKKVYVAKKMFMSGLKEKEQVGALQEVRLLKELDHPQIVTYKDSFKEGDLLIIVMEYCEEGDLSYFLKKKQKNNELLDESLILNWFLQISTALIFIHSKKILHRDLKTSNIFLTSNWTIKLGDFGISRVLENTQEAANTVVGTPYYMSPEVCQSKPYSYKSDVWALGCILYELCTLNHAFDSNNLLGLVYKIVKDSQGDIADKYSKELKNLVSLLLTKDENKRPTLNQVIQSDFLQKTIKDFIENKGKKEENNLPIKRTQTHKLIEENEDLDQIKETPMQRIQRKKREAAEEQERMMIQAARESTMNRNVHKEKKMKEFFGVTNPNNTKNSFDITVESQHFQNTQNEFDKTVLSQSLSNSKLNEEGKNYDEKSIGTLVSSKFDTLQTEDFDISKTVNIPNIDEGPKKENEGEILKLETQYIEFKPQKSKSNQIKNEMGSVQISTETYLKDDFEEYWSDGEGGNNRLTAKAGEKELNQVLDIYKEQLVSESFSHNKPSYNLNHSISTLRTNKPDFGNSSLSSTVL